MALVDLYHRILAFVIFKHLWTMFPSYGSKSLNWKNKSTDCFLYDENIVYKWVIMNRERLIIVTASDACIFGTIWWNSWYCHSITYQRESCLPNLGFERYDKLFLYKCRNLEVFYENNCMHLMRHKPTK